jgi:hypothetical protein
MMNSLSIISQLNDIKRDAILNVLNYNNKLNESCYSINYSSFLYEFVLYFEQYIN